MSSLEVPSQITIHHEPAPNTKRIWRAFWILSVVTLGELALGLSIYNIHKGPNPSEMMVLFFKGVICILTLAKGYYIAWVFMHMGDESKLFRRSIVVPLLLFIWFIIAFLHDGNAYREARDSNAGEFKVIKNDVPAAVLERGQKD